MRKKNKTNAFFRSVTLQILAGTLYSFKTTDLCLFVKVKKNRMDLIKFLHVRSTLKTFDVEQGLPE